VGWHWVHLVHRALFGLYYQPRVMVDDECRVIGGMICRGKRNTWRKPAPVPLCPPQIPHDLTWTQKPSRGNRSTNQTFASRDWGKQRMLGRGNRNSRRKPAPLPLCPPQIPHDLNWARSQVTVAGGRRLASWAVAWPWLNFLWFLEPGAFQVSQFSSG
jgi:hypothetical protein